MPLRHLGPASIVRPRHFFKQKAISACPHFIRGSLDAVLPNKPHHRRANCQALLAWFSGALALVVAGSGCQMMSHTQNSDGVRMFQQAYYQGALQSFQQAIQSDPSNPDGYYNVARTYHQLGKLHNQPADLQQADHTHIAAHVWITASLWAARHGAHARATNPTLRAAPTAAPATVALHRPALPASGSGLPRAAWS